MRVVAPIFGSRDAAGFEEPAAAGALEQIGNQSWVRCFRFCLGGIAQERKGGLARPHLRNTESVRIGGRRPRVSKAAQLSTAREDRALRCPYLLHGAGVRLIKNSFVSPFPSVLPPGEEGGQATRRARSWAVAACCVPPSLLPLPRPPHRRHLLWRRHPGKSPPLRPSRGPLGIVGA